MSTRANVRLTQTINETKGRKKTTTTHTIWLYHHHDGYPSFLGATLWEWLNKKNYRANTHIADLATELVKHGVPFTDSTTNIEGIDNDYEITIDRHDDIEFLYEIKLPTWNCKWTNGEWDDQREEDDITFTIFDAWHDNRIIKSGLVSEFDNTNWERL